MSDGARRVAIAAESARDADRVRVLVDRLVTEGIAWVRDGGVALEHLRRWVGLDEGVDWFDLHAVKKEAARRGLRLLGHEPGEPAVPGEPEFRKLLQLFRVAWGDEGVVALVVVRDLDRCPEHREGWNRVARAGWPFLPLGALARPELEAWLVVAAAPADEAERAALETVRGRLGFDPTHYPERLTSGREQDKKDAKRVLRELCAVGRDADARWEALVIDDDLLGRAEACGLAAFVGEVREKLVPALER